MWGPMHAFPPPPSTHPITRGMQNAFGDEAPLQAHESPLEAYRCTRRYEMSHMVPWLLLLLPLYMDVIDW